MGQKKHPQDQRFEDDGSCCVSQTPQFVYFTFDDAVTVAGSRAYQDLFNANRRNPNGCRITATLFASNQYTSYKEVRKLYDLGFEIADHSISHRTPTTWWKTADYEEIKKEFVGMREIESKSTGIPLNHILGVRVPFLAKPPGLFRLLKENHFGYDSTVTNTGTPIWPYKHDSGLWELPLNVWRFKSTGCGGMVDGCRPQTKADTLTFLRENFRRHHDAPDKPPFGISMHSAWFLAPEWKYRKEALNEFIDELLANPDVWIVTPTQLLVWMESPVSKDKLYNYAPFQCQSRGK
ncbi:uncharacterized protein LOC106156626 [Lingula anatina]|uniref:Uncharacterized protein LOC106156626 n=1 Tax=Lingula anatina TaxID=7574 RepID=A0A1S3HN12_LINAN|nr:uncharacterized protein LOC106156626 [Lingula anatina]|eukprot:XP_013387417.1 uncharacterized protein LOC106156626 [Lingula anatina]